MNIINDSKIVIYQFVWNLVRYWRNYNNDSIIVTSLSYVLQKIKCKASSLFLRSHLKLISPNIINDIRIEKIPIINYTRISKALIREVLNFISKLEEVYGILLISPTDEDSYGGETVFSFKLANEKLSLFVKVYLKKCHGNKIFNEIEWLDQMNNHELSIVKPIFFEIYRSLSIIAYPMISDFSYLSAFKLEKFTNNYKVFVLNGIDLTNNIHTIKRNRFIVQELNLILLIINCYLKKRNVRNLLVTTYRELYNPLIKYITTHASENDLINFINHNDLHPRNVLEKNGTFHMIDNSSFGLSIFGSDLAFLSIMLNLNYNEYKKIITDSTPESILDNKTILIASEIYYSYKILEQKSNTNDHEYLNQQLELVFDNLTKKNMGF
jgi:hypothetical protein